MSEGPRRTCIGCREVQDKWCLVRLVCGSEGTVVVDRTGRLVGRGAYVCGTPPCVARLGKGGRLAQAFRRTCRPAAGLSAAVEEARRSMAVHMGRSSS